MIHRKLYIFVAIDYLFDVNRLNTKRGGCDPTSDNAMFSLFVFCCVVGSRLDHASWEKEAVRWNRTER